MLFREGLVALARELEADLTPRWTWWSAAEIAPTLVTEGIVLQRSWDIAEAHRILHGGWEAGPGVAWAASHGIPIAGVPAPPSGDLFEFASATPDDGRLVRPDGHLRPDAVTGDWLDADERLLLWAEALADGRATAHGGASPGPTRRGDDPLRVGGRGALCRAGPARPPPSTG